MAEELTRSEKLLMKLAGASVDIDFEPQCTFEEICMCLINGETWDKEPQTRMEELLLQLPSGGSDEWEEVLLWENPNKSDGIAAGTVYTLNDSALNYDYFKIIIHPNIDRTDFGVKTFIISNADAKNGAFLVGGNGLSRGFLIGKKTGTEDDPYAFRVQTGGYSIGSNQQNTKAVIPHYVYGIRKKS